MVYSSTPTPRTRSSSSSSKDTIIASRRQNLNNPNLQIVTQALHIPPKIDIVPNEGIEELNEANANEVERLRRDMKKLKDYLKTSVQERKMLVKKIGTLNDRVAAAHVRKSVSPEKSTMTDSPRIADMSFEDRSFEDLGIQCSLPEEQSKDDPNFWKFNFASFARELDGEVLENHDANPSIPSIVNNLNMSEEAIARLESILLENEDCKEKFINLLEALEPSSEAETSNRHCYRLNVTNVTNCYKRRSYIEPDHYLEDKSRMSSECLGEESMTGQPTKKQDGNTSYTTALNQAELQSCSSMASSLPDPNMIDLLELSFDNASTALQGVSMDPPNGSSVITLDSPFNTSINPDDTPQQRRFNHDVERRRRDLEHKAILLDALEDQNKEKDKIIRDQAGVLEEYRMEILRLRDERRENNGQQPFQHQTKKRHQRKTLSSESQQVNPLKHSVFS